MALSKTPSANVFYGVSVPLLGIGLCVPLVECDSMRTVFGLGLAGVIALVLTVFVIARIGPGLPRNIRIGLAAFTGAGITILSGMALARLPLCGDAPFLAAAPFVILAASLIADAPLPEPKKTMARSLVETIVTGLSFAALLGVLGGLRVLIEKSPAALNPVRFFASVPGALLLIALPALFAELVAARRKGETR
jgi:Na+-translocating ferredoxin:NAD+ oxidoreductase RnfE subunit